MTHYYLLINGTVWLVFGIICAADSHQRYQAKLRQRDWKKPPYPWADMGVVAIATVLGAASLCLM